MRITLQPVRVTNECDEEGHLVFADGRLAAVLVRLSDPIHGDAVGSWFLEAFFEGAGWNGHPTFESLDAAQDWVAESLKDRRSARLA